MGRPPCCDKSSVKRGLWTEEEDLKLIAYTNTHGIGNWTSVPKKAGSFFSFKTIFIISLYIGKKIRYFDYYYYYYFVDDICMSSCHFVVGLKRCGKSCRLRWTNYLRPNLKHESFTPQEEEMIITLHATIGSRYICHINFN